MKFCKSLQRMMDISDPEWAPYYTNYKLLKKIIKALPHQQPPLEKPAPRSQSPATPALVPCAPPELRVPRPSREAATTERQSGGENAAQAPERLVHSPPPDATPLAAIVTHPVEQNFFRLLHQEVRKVSFFYHKLLQELCLRYERIQNTVQLCLADDRPAVPDRVGSSAAASNTTSYSVYRLLQEEETTAESRHPAVSTDRTTERRLRTLPSTSPPDRRRPHHYFLCNQSIYHLYRDLLFLELYSIMALTSFSKILKKHDKVTGYSTKYAFMTKLVLPANFVADPMLQPMMQQCLEWYERITARWQQEEEQDASLLFLDMIRRLRSHVPATE